MQGSQMRKRKELPKMKAETCKLKFCGWNTANPNDWDSWVDKMCSIHQSTWENAGIYEAIMSSTFIIKRQDELILELASRWCSETNTFGFPWGKATLTLEDMLVLGGFSASGISALSSLENDFMSRQIKDRLEIARIEIRRTKAKATPQCVWMEKFKESGSDLEHEAFLTLWLSRYIFPTSTTSKIINKQAIPVAARLSRGIKISLGPIVLAMLYNDLGSLAKTMRFTQLAANSEGRPTNLCALFHLVQIWAWERFPMLKPVPNCMYFGENFPRLARWSNVKIRNVKDLKSAINSAENSFLWCPYDSSAKREVRDHISFGRCIEVIELIGFDSCIEKYQPQLVARQFGLDQNTGQNSSVVKDVKVENEINCVNPGFTPPIEVINVSDSDSDSDHEGSAAITELLRMPIFETGSRTPLSYSLASPDVMVEDECFMDKSEASKGAQIQTQAEVVCVDESDDEQLQNSNMVSPTSKNESNEEMVNVEFETVHETREDEGMSNDAESYTNEIFKISDSELEARISSLEDTVYAHIRILEAAMRS